MIDRYSLPEMKAIWEPQHKYDNWLKVELAIVQAQAEDGRIPREASEAICERAESALGGRAPLARALEIEKTTRHDMLGFVGAVLDFLVIAFVLFIFVSKVVKATEARFSRAEAPPGTKLCTRCLEQVAVKATRCKFCTSELA